MRGTPHFNFQKAKPLLHAAFVVMMGLSLSASSLSPLLLDLTAECQELAEKEENKSEEKKDSKEKMEMDDFISQSIKYSFSHLKLSSPIDIIGDSWSTPCVAFPTPPPEGVS